MQLENHTKADTNYYVEAEKVLDVAQRAHEIFESSEDEEKRQFLQFMLQNSVLNGRKVDFTLQTTFQQLLEYTEHKAWLPLIDMFRTRQMILPTDDLLFPALMS